MESILITGGDLPDYKSVKDLFNNKFICVADSGLDWAIKNKIHFDHVVGDMDSVTVSEHLNSLPVEKVTRLPVDKDDTDTLFGLKFLKSKGADKIILIGGGGGRIDHLLGIVSLFDTEYAPDLWFTARERIFYVTGRIDLTSYTGYNLSVFPLNKVVCSIHSYGLKWELTQVKWLNRSIGVSNTVEKNNSWIDAKGNKVLIILPIKGKSFE